MEEATTNILSTMNREWIHKVLENSVGPELFCIAERKKKISWVHQRDINKTLIHLEDALYFQGSHFLVTVIYTLLYFV